MNTYILELAIYTEFSGHLEHFFRDLGSPICYDCIVQLWKNKLRFSSTLMPNRKGNLGRETVCDARGINPRVFSQFASKFNLAVSLSKNERDVFIKIIRNSSKGITLGVTIVANTLASQMVLDNFFSLIDDDLNKNLNS